MVRQSVFTAQEARVGAWVLVVAALLIALGFSGVELASPSIPDRVAFDSPIDEAQPLQAADLGL